MPKALIIAILIIVLLPITKAEKTIAYIEGDTPVRIIIPEVSIDLKVTKSEIIDGTWDVPDNNAGFGEGSHFLNENSGNSIIFAHARRNLFRNLRNIKQSSEIKIMGSEGVYIYKVKQIQYIDPVDV